MANTFLQELLGEAYKEGMTEDEIADAIRELKLKKPKDSAPNGEDGEIKHLRSLLSKANSEAADYKKQLRDRMSEAEQREADEKEARDKLEQMNQELSKRISISENSAKLISLGYDAELASKTAEALFAGDINAVVENQKAFITKREQDLKAELMRGTPKLPAGTPPEGMTLKKLREMSMQDRLQYANDHPDDYKALYESDKEN